MAIDTQVVMLLEVLLIVHGIHMLRVGCRPSRDNSGGHRMSSLIDGTDGRETNVGRDRLECLELERLDFCPPSTRNSCEVMALHCNAGLRRKQIDPVRNYSKPRGKYRSPKNSIFDFSTASSESLPNIGQEE